MAKKLEQAKKVQKTGLSLISNPMGDVALYARSDNPMIQCHMQAGYVAEANKALPKGAKWVKAPAYDNKNPSDDAANVGGPLYNEG